MNLIDLPKQAKLAALSRFRGQQQQQRNRYSAQTIIHEIQIEDTTTDAVRVYITPIVRRRRGTHWAPAGWLDKLMST